MKRFIILFIFALAVSAYASNIDLTLDGVRYTGTVSKAGAPTPPAPIPPAPTPPPTPPQPVVGTLLESGKEVITSVGFKGTALYRANVPVPFVASFANATKDWSTRRDMLVMYAGATCNLVPPTIADHTTIITSIANGSLTSKSDTGVLVNGRTFYYNFQDVNNQSVIIGRLWKPAAPAGCYYVLIYNVSSGDSVYSLTFSSTPK